MAEPAREDIVAAMQAAILVGDWLLADKIALDHFDLSNFETDPCRWCGRDAQTNVIWYETHTEHIVDDGTNVAKQYAIPLCSDCELRNIAFGSNIFRTCRNRSWCTQKPG